MITPLKLLKFNWSHPWSHPWLLKFKIKVIPDDLLTIDHDMIMVKMKIHFHCLCKCLVNTTRRCENNSIKEKYKYLPSNHQWLKNILNLDRNVWKVCESTKCHDFECVVRVSAVIALSVIFTVLCPCLNLRLLNEKSPLAFTPSLSETLCPADHNKCTLLSDITQFVRRLFRNTESH